MIPIPSAIQTQLDGGRTFPVRLFEIGGTSTLRFTDVDVDVAWNGQIYERRGVSYQKIRRKLGMELDTYVITIDNLDDLIIAWSQTADQRGYTSSGYKGISTGALDAQGKLQLIDDVAIRLFYGRNTALKADSEFEITVSANLDFHMQRAARTVQSTSCRFRFKDANCGYTGPATVCNYTAERCKQLGNFQRFGGFPDLNSRQEN